MLAEFLIPLFGTVAAFTMVCLLLSVFENLPDFSGKGVPAGSTLLYFLASMPRTLNTILPFSALLAVSWTMVILGKNNELTAIRAAGASLLSAASFLLLTSLLLGAAIFAITEYAIPRADRYVTRIQQDYLEHGTKKAKRKAQLVFRSADRRREWFFAEFHPNGTGHGVSVRLLDENGRTEAILSAETAHYAPEEHRWHFQNGSETRMSYEANGTATQERPQPFPARICFQDNPRDMAIQSRNCEELSMAELLRLRRRPKGLPAKTLRLADVLLAYRATAPFAPLIATLLAFAMTIAIGRKTVVKGFVLAVALFMLYYVAAQFVLVLGKNGHLPPLLAGSLPTLLALALAFTLAKQKQ